MHQELELLKKKRNQLRFETQIQPIPMSKTLNDLVNYVETNLPNDKLVTGFERPKENPFLAGRESCVVSWFKKKKKLLLFNYNV